MHHMINQLQRMLMKGSATTYEIAVVCALNCDCVTLKTAQDMLAASSAKGEHAWSSRTEIQLEP